MSKLKKFYFLATSCHGQTFHISDSLCQLRVDSLHKGSPMQGFDHFFAVRLDKHLNKQSSGRWNGTPLLIEAECYKDASVNLASIAIDNGSFPVRRQAIIWTCADLLSFGPFECISVNFKSKYNSFHQRKCIWKYRMQRVGYIASASVC